MGFKNDFDSAKAIIGHIASGAKVSKFSYDDKAYNEDTYQGVSTFSPNNHNNIPVSDASVMHVNSSVVDFGFRSQASTISRMLINHFFGRVSYNLNKIYDTLNTILTMLSESMGEGGFAQLDGTGRVPVSQLPVDTLVYVDDWDASTNTPHLEDGDEDATKGDFYIVAVAGTQTFGGVTYNFLVNDRIVYGASGVWKRLPGGEVRTVNTMPAVNGDVTLRGSNIAVSPTNNNTIEASLNLKSPIFIENSIYTVYPADGIKAVFAPIGTVLLVQTKPGLLSGALSPIKVGKTIQGNYFYAYIDSSGELHVKYDDNTVRTTFFLLGTWAVLGMAHPSSWSQTVDVGASVLIQRLS